jgi:hypothetical protein
MNVPEANALLDVAFIHTARLNWSVWWLRELQGEGPAFVDFRRAAGGIMGEIFDFVLAPIQNSFPQLANRVGEPSDILPFLPSDPASVIELRQRCLEFVASLSEWLKELNLQSESESDFKGAISHYRRLVDQLDA